MILAALSDYYARLLERDSSGEDISLPGYSQEKISFEIVLAPDGRVVDVNDIRDLSGKKPVPRNLSVPASFKRPGVTPKSFFLWDKSSYVLGVEKGGKDGIAIAIKTHEAFKAFHRQVLDCVDDVGVKSLLVFLSKWSPEYFKPPLFREEMLDANFVFRVDGEREYLHDRPAARIALSRLLAGEEHSHMGMCLVTGENQPIARLHPSIKGFESTGSSIVSFNADSFLSYKGSLAKLHAIKKENDSGANAPVSEQSAFAYTTALNYLLRRSEHNHQRLQIGDVTVVFWAQADSNAKSEAAEELIEAFFNPPSDDGQETQKLRDVLDNVAKGRPLKELNPNLDDGTRIFVLGLSPNASRLSIRFWQSDTLNFFAQRLAQHFFDLQIQPLPWRREPAVRWLIKVTGPYRKKGERGEYDGEAVSPLLAGELMRAILTGNRYPRSLLSTLIMRMRSDGEVSGVRVALCKGVLARDKRMGVKGTEEEIPVSRDTNNKTPGYLLGRLFYQIEKAQKEAIGETNAGVKEKYYGSASATPALVFPVIMRNLQNHLSKLRKSGEGKAIAGAIDREIRQIIDCLPPYFPKSLNIEAQGYFAIGYYHESQARFSQKDGQDATATEQGDEE